jgi:hypothetical protein
MTDMMFSSKEAALAFGSGFAAYEQRETFHAWATRRVPVFPP